MKKRRNTLQVKYAGLTWLARDLARIKGISYTLIRQRIKRGWTEEKLVAKPYSRKLPMPRFANRYRGLM